MIRGFRVASAAKLRVPFTRIALSPRGVIRLLLGGLALLFPFGSPPALAQGKTVLLTFLHTNDLHGRVFSGRDFDDDRQGGLARATAIARKLRNQLPHVFFVDSGDLIHGSPVEFLTQGRSMVEAMNMAGIDVACPGNHEFDWGQDAAQAAMRRAQFPWVTANVVERETGQPFPPVQPYVIKEADGVRIAFFGLTTLQTVDLEWPPFINRVRFLDPFDTAKKLVPELRKQADLVVLLSHLGAKEDALLAASVPGIDLILGGHSQSTLQRRVEIGGTVIAQAGFYGQYLGRVDLIMERKKEDGWRVASVNGRGGRWWKNVPGLNAEFPKTALIPLGPDLFPDAAVSASYRNYWEQWRDLGKAVVGRSSGAITDGGAAGDTPLSRFLADRLREATGADIAMVDGKWRGTLPEGDVPASAIWGSMGGYTGQNILRMTVTGAQLRRFLDQWAGLPEGLAVGISGITARVNPKAKDGERVKEVAVGGKPLEEDQAYTLAGVMYVVRRFPSLMESAPGEIVGEVEWSRPLILDAARKLRTFSPDLSPRLVLESDQ
ncbi:MAG: bifunctional metallophosphatase/5'-nucleotidase [Armatimonadetes bacterium]|nr:bifunctional metallophosphatase/5'-nucleotidase [Armatimonadota bacterium]